MPHSKKKKKKRQFYSQSDPTNLQKHTVNMFFLKKKKPNDGNGLLSLITLEMHLL